MSPSPASNKLYIVSLPVQLHLQCDVQPIGWGISLAVKGNVPLGQLVAMHGWFLAAMTELELLISSQW